MAKGTDFLQAFKLCFKFGKITWKDEMCKYTL